MLDMRIGLDMNSTTYCISSVKSLQEPDILDIRSILDIENTKHSNCGEKV